MRIKTIFKLTMVLPFLFVANVNAKGKAAMKMSKGSFKNKVDSVAIVSVHGACLINGRNIKSKPLISIGTLNKEDKITEKDISDTVQALVEKLDNLVANADYYPFDFIGHEQVMKTKSYQKLISQNLRYSQSEGALLSQGIGNLFKKDKSSRDEASDITAGYYTVQNYGIYVLPPSEVIQLGGTKKKEMEAIFADLGGADAILTSRVVFSFYPKGMALKGGLMGALSGGGRAKGVCKVDITLGMEMANGKQILVASSWAESNKDWLFRNIENQATIKGNEVAIAKDMATKAFNEAWGLLEKKIAPKMSNLQK